MLQHKREKTAVHKDGRLAITHAQKSFTTPNLLHLHVPECKKYGPVNGFAHQTVGSKFCDLGKRKSVLARIVYNPRFAAFREGQILKSIVSEDDSAVERVSQLKRLS